MELENDNDFCHVIEGDIYGYLIMLSAIGIIISSRF